MKGISVHQGKTLVRLMMLGSVAWLAACGDSGDGAATTGMPTLEVLVTQAERRDVPLTLDMVGKTLELLPMG